MCFLLDTTNVLSKYVVAGQIKCCIMNQEQIASRVFFLKFVSILGPIVFFFFNIIFVQLSSSMFNWKCSSVECTDHFKCFLHCWESMHDWWPTDVQIFQLSDRVVPGSLKRLNRLVNAVHFLKLACGKHNYVKIVYNMALKHIYLEKKGG